MITMTALVGFSDRDLATEHNPAGSVAARSPFTAPNAEIAKRLEATGQAERAKTPPSDTKS